MDKTVPAVRIVPRVRIPADYSVLTLWGKIVPAAPLAHLARAAHPARKVLVCPAHCNPPALRANRVKQGKQDSRGKANRARVNLGRVKVKAKDRVRDKVNPAKGKAAMAMVPVKAARMIMA